ncbi:hypothetical protein VTI74DRAFT_3491 [Chaetomium olivicolor]
MHFCMGGLPLVILSTHQAAHDLLDRPSASYSDRPLMLMSGELVTRGMYMLLRQYDERYRTSSRGSCCGMCWASTTRWAPRGWTFTPIFERAMASFIYSLNYGYRLRTGYEKELMDGKKVQVEFARTGQVGAYHVDSFPSLNYLLRFLAPWKRDADELYELERQLHVGNLDKSLTSETLRWRPIVVGGVPHFTKVADSYMGYHIPTNSIVLANAFAITRDESVLTA